MTLEGTFGRQKLTIHQGGGVDVGHNHVEQVTLQVVVLIIERVAVESSASPEVRGAYG